MEGVKIVASDQLSKAVEEDYEERPDAPAYSSNK
jgi:hypothetical protein